MGKTRRFGILALMLLVLPTSLLAAEPKERDTRENRKPKSQIQFLTSISPEDAKPGATVTYKVEAKIKDGWHLYAYAKEPVADGPTATQFDLFDLDGLETDGDWTPSAKPEKKKDPNFEQPIELHEGTISWSIKLKLPKNATGEKKIRNQIHFMLCDATKCLPPTYWTLEDATVSVGKKAALRPVDRDAVLAATLIGVETIPKPPATGAERSMTTLIVESALGGLLALLMPCVWPMIPITVNFFVKQGEAKNGQPVKLAIFYCLAIIAIFTSLGLVVTLLQDATGVSVTSLGSNPWINLTFGVAFVVMGLMLLGLFEIHLPNFLLNFSSKNEGRGGLVGVMFMATTLTITSFTCTAPVVGGLLGEAAAGGRLHPIIGMLVFSTVLAVPFLVLSLVPSLLHKMPRSGDWMNAVKVVGGLAEIALAFKFLNVAEIGFGTSADDAWIDASVTLTAWVVAALVSGVYLLGLFKTDHDSDVVKVGPARMMLGALALGLALYLAPALFGNPPKSRLYSQIVGILPQDSDKFDKDRKTLQNDINSVVTFLKDSKSGPAVATDKPGDKPAAPSNAFQRPQKATSTDPKTALREEKRLHGVVWGMSYEAAIEEAKKSGKPVLIDFTGVNCANCRTVESSIMTRPEVIELMKKFITVQLYTDTVDIGSIPSGDRRRLAEENLDREDTLTGEITSPLYVVVDAAGKVLGKTGYSADHGFLGQFLAKALEKSATGEKVARGE